MEAGEKNTKYFVNLEKRNRENLCNKIVINGATNENPKDVSNLYPNSIVNYIALLINPLIQIYFLANLSDDINKITTDFRNVCDKELNIQEVIDCINSLKENKSPGNDGLTGEFYKTFCDYLHLFYLPFLKNLLILENFLHH